MTIATTIRRRLRPWKEPTFEAPYPIDAAELQPLGEYRGSAWYTHALGELEQRRRTYTDRDIIPSGPVTVETIDGDRRYTSFTVRPPGTYAATIAGTPGGPKPPKPARPVDAIAGAFLADRRPELVVAPPVHEPSGVAITDAGTPASYYRRPPEPAVRGAGAILARLDRAGATVRLSADGSALVVASAGGRSGPGIAELVAVSLPLLVPFLRDGRAPACNVRDHGKERAEAVSLVVGGALACAACLAGEA